jgi:hypothetical protein
MSLAFAEKIVDFSKADRADPAKFRRSVVRFVRPGDADGHFECLESYPTRQCFKQHGTIGQCQLWSHPVHSAAAADPVFDQFISSEANFRTREREDEQA